MLKLTKIFIYPIKGCAGIAVDHAELLGRGLKHDRRWMLVDEDNTFVSQRSFSQLALINLMIEEAHLVLTYKEQSHRIPLQTPNSGEAIPVKVWNDVVKGFLTSEKDHQWFSNILKRKVRLVTMLKDSVRPVDPRYAITKQEEVSFADGYPFLIIGQASLDKLNSKVDGEQLKIDRFRPNLVFSGGEPHVEDTWNEFAIGKNQFYGVKPCARCQVTTIDQQTGVSGKEPLKTLSGYRKKGNKILFGQNCLLMSGDVIKINDEITVLKTGEAPI